MENDNQETMVFNSEEIMNQLALNTLKEVVESLKLRGYDPIKQVVGYLVSGDPGYITSFQDARNKICTLDRNALLELMLKETLKL
ncbi:MAG: IreB family regulatory phosphoprotein [Bacilli bacterium]